jgi:hypothetical protein
MPLDNNEKAAGFTLGGLFLPVFWAWLVSDHAFVILSLAFCPMRRILGRLLPLDGDRRANQRLCKHFIYGCDRNYV